MKKLLSFSFKYCSHQYKVSGLFPYKFQCQNLNKIAAQIDYKILHHFKVLTHGTLHSNKCLPNMRCAIFQKQITNRLHTIFSYGMIQMTDKNHHKNLIASQNFDIMLFSQVAKNVIVNTFFVNHIFSSKYMFTCYYPAGKYWPLKRPKKVPSNVPRTSP